MLYKSVLLLILAGCFQISFLLMIIRRMREKLLRSKESNKQNEVFARPMYFVYIAPQENSNHLFGQKLKTYNINLAIVQIAAMVHIKC